MNAWYFSSVYRRLRHGDGRRIEIGATHTVKGPVSLCGHGLHASVRALDALGYAPGPVLWRVELGGDIVTSSDKVCASERTYIAGGVDASDMLRAFARWCALSVSHLWDCPDVVARYLVTGDEMLWYDAERCARDAAGGAARDAAGVAARAARDAAGAAAWVAARAARDAAGTAAEGEQSEQFERMCHDLLNGNHWWEANR